MSEERITQWAAVDAERNVIATFKDHKDAGSYAAARSLTVAKLVQVQYYETIVTCAELWALREKAKGVTLNPAPAPEATAAPGEPLRVQMVPVSLLDEVVKKRDEWKARAEKAERERDEAIDKIRHADQRCESANKRADDQVELTKQWSLRAIYAESKLAGFIEDGGMSGAEVRTAKDDERARFERETARTLMTRIIETRPLEDGGTRCFHMGPDDASKEARILANIHFREQSS